MLGFKNTFATFALLTALVPATVMAEPGPREVKLETIHIHNDAAAWQVFDSFRDGLATTGIGVAQDLDKKRSLVASYGFARTGSDNHIPSGAGQGEGFVAAFTAHQLSAGLRRDLGLTNQWVEPYGSARATLLIGAVQLDDDLEQDDNKNQLQATAFSPGASLAAGVSGFVPVGALHVRIDLEMGYAYSLKMKAGEFGELQFQGVHGLVGAGVRF